MKYRAIQVLGYLVLFVGSGLALVLIFALSLPRHWDPLIFFLTTLFSVYLIHVGVRAIVFGRHGGKKHFEWGRAFHSLVKMFTAEHRKPIAPAAIPRTHYIVEQVGKTYYIRFIALGIIQAILGGLMFFSVIMLVIATAGYLGVGPGTFPVLLFCIYGVVTGIRLAVRRTLKASRAAAIWNLPIALFFAWAAFAAGPHLDRLIPAVIFFGLFVILIIPGPRYRKQV